eukprot:11184286-Lingulodinium_polyedra.AAC.1
MQDTVVPVPWFGRSESATPGAVADDSPFPVRAQPFWLGIIRGKTQRHVGCRLCAGSGDWCARQVARLAAR